MFHPPGLPIGLGFLATTPLQCHGLLPVSTLHLPTVAQRMALLVEQRLSEPELPLPETSLDSSSPPDLATAPHKSPPDTPPTAASPTKYAASKYAHAESTSPASRELRCEQWEDRLR